MSKTKKQTQTPETEWVFLPVHKSRTLKILPKAVLLAVDYNVSTILPSVFKRTKEDENYMYFSLPSDFKVNFRVSTQNPKTRRFTHTDRQGTLKELKELALDKPLKDIEEEEQEFVGENMDSIDVTDDDLPF